MRRQCWLKFVAPGLPTRKLMVAFDERSATVRLDGQDPAILSESEPRATVGSIVLTYDSLAKAVLVTREGTHDGLRVEPLWCRSVGRMSYVFCEEEWGNAGMTHDEIQTIRETNARIARTARANRRRSLPMAA